MQSLPQIGHAAALFIGERDLGGTRNDATCSQSRILHKCSSDHFAHSSSSDLCHTVVASSIVVEFVSVRGLARNPERSRGWLRSGPNSKVLSLVKRLWSNQQLLIHTHPAHESYRCSNSKATEVMALTPVLIVGSGSGAKMLECNDGSGSRPRRICFRCFTKPSLATADNRPHWR